MKTKILSPLRRDGYKAGMIMMLIALSTMLLTTACSNDDDLAANNNEITNKKGFEIPVTINVTRQGDATTRASFDGSKLNFSAGDKLFVRGYYNGYYNEFAGTLEYDTESGKFKGTIYTEDDTYKTYEALFAASDETSATLLPAGYKDHGYLVINTEGTEEKYDDYVEESNEYTLATSKAAGVAQFSYEKSYYYDDGFALNPYNAILNFTITGLAANTSVNVSLTSIAYNITGTVTTNASGTATFAAGIKGELNLQPFSLTVAGNPITIVSSDKEVEEGKIYNITRSAVPAPAATDLSTINANYTASDGETLTGTLGSNVKISIADGATVTLNNVTINGVNDSNYDWAGITCLGDATIILSGTNTVKGFYGDYPGIQAAAGKTLIINGTGSLTASSYGWGAGIGGGSGSGAACGNIEIQGGTITATSVEYGAGIGGGNNSSWGNITISGGTVTATGGYRGAGIGGGRKSSVGSVSCGNILISGGTVTATGGEDAAGIGGGRGYNSGIQSSCGTITITSGVTEVTATKGEYATNSIGAGNVGTCGTVTIGGNEGAITTSPYTYQP